MADFGLLRHVEGEQELYRAQVSHYIVAPRRTAVCVCVRACVCVCVCVCVCMRVCL